MSEEQLGQKKKQQVAVHIQQFVAVKMNPN